MDFALTEEQKMLQKMTRDFAREEIEPHIREWEENGGIPREIFDKMAKLGMLGATAPPEYGGSGMDNVSYHVMMEEIARVCSSLRTAMSVHISLCQTTIMKFGSEEQKRKYLAPLAKGEKLGAWALTEPDAGSDAANQRTTARPEADSYILNGTKMFISNGSVADIVIIFARLPGTKRHEGLCPFVVEKGMGGFYPGTVESNTKLGLRASPTAELILEDCAVPKENLVGREGQGWEIAMDILNHGRLSVAAGAVGVARACLEESIEFAKAREAFGRPIAKFQLIREMIAEMAMGIEAGRLLVYKAASLVDRGEDPTLAASEAKLFTAKMVMKAADYAVQIHGGYGYSSEYPVERYFRDAKIHGIYEGTNQIQTLVIAREVLGE
ncbi:MAG: acyl-CoA dehydrogenase family protein [Thermoplasmata archaeon]